jgi:DNA-binding NarL/FixJ family response regulator
MNSPKILIADTQSLTTLGLRHLIVGNSLGEIVAEITDFIQLKEKLLTISPHLLIIDYQKVVNLRLDFFLEIRSRYPATRLLVISTDEDKDRIFQVLEFGVSGYLTKECSSEEILLAIKSILKGEKFFCHKIYNLLLEKKNRKNEPAVSNQLSTREREVLKLIVEGNSTQKIADRLNVSYHTINSHRKSIIKKLKIKSPTELVIHALDLGILSAKYQPATQSAI